MLDVKKRVIIVTVFLFITVVMFINFYLELSNETSIIEFIQQPNRISEKEWQWLRNQGQLIYGADNNSPPLRFVDKQSGQYSGIVVDYLRALSLEIGVEIKYTPLVWEKALKELEKGNTDICDMYPSPERAKKYLFTKPIYNQKGVILVPKDEAEIQNYHDLKGKKIALQKGDYVYEFLSGELNEADYAFTPDYYRAILLLIDDKVDAVVGDEPVLSYFIDSMGIKGEYTILENELYEKESILAVPKSEKELLNILNYGISILQKKNTMAKIHRKWFGISAPFIKNNATEKYFHITIIVLYIFALSVFIFLFWNNQLKNEVSRQTKKLNISRKELETTFNSLFHLMIVIDEHYTIVNVNTSFCKNVQMEKEEIIGSGITQFSDLLYNEKNEQLLKKTFENGESAQVEVKQQDKIYEMSILPLEEEESIPIHRVLIMMKDITKLRISEQQILQSNKMSAVGHLAAGVAHEIRNPLGIIRNYCYVLKKSREKDFQKFDQAIEIIESSVEKAGNIIRNLLEFSRISDNQNDTVNLLELITSIFALEYKVIARQRIKEEIECDSSIYCSVNRESLKHILINCISNAVYAMPDGGILKLSITKNDSVLTIVCSDNGTGISEEDKEKIFNPFFSKKNSSEGTGLGLYITYNEVKKLGGDILVQSELGKGSTFIITVPAEEISV